MKKEKIAAINALGNSIERIKDKIESGNDSDELYSELERETNELKKLMSEK